VFPDVEELFLRPELEVIFHLLSLDPRFPYRERKRGDAIGDHSLADRMRGHMRKGKGRRGRGQRCMKRLREEMQVTNL